MTAYYNAAPKLGATMAKIVQVIVRKKPEDLFWVCQALHNGFRCARCRRGLLGMVPAKGQRCRVCKAEVAQVVSDDTHRLRGSSRCLKVDSHD